MPWWLVLLLVGLAFVAGAGVAMVVLRQRRQQRRPGPGRDRKRSTAYESVYPLPIPVFRSLVAHLAQQKAATRPGQFTAQDGEDVLLAELFGYKTDGFFIEIGAYDGLYLSNSYFFEQLGWRGLLVEPLPEKAAACRRNRPGGGGLCARKPGGKLQAALYRPCRRALRSAGRPQGVVRAALAETPGLYPQPGLRRPCRRTARL